MVTLRMYCSKQLAVMSKQVVTDTVRMFVKELLCGMGAFTARHNIRNFQYLLEN
jgi:hypothetical protein